MKLGFLYAGQGSQHAGMGADLYEAFSAFRAVYDHAEVDFDLKKVTFEDPDGIINQTRYTQPCMVAFAAGVTAELAAAHGIREIDLLPFHRLGESKYAVIQQPYTMPDATVPQEHIDALAALLQQRGFIVSIGG
mgnify:CR=1 FL=1